MKTKNLKRAAVLVAATVVVAGAVHLVSTKRASGTETTLGMLSETSVVEMPAVAASLVQKAKGEGRSVAVQEVIKNILALERPCALPYVVSAICHQAPDMAANAVVCAVQSQPDDAKACLESGVAAAPQQAEAIVSALVKEFPEAYAAVAYLAAKEVPSKEAAILAAVGQAIPSLNPYVQKALAEADAGQMDMAKTLGQVADAAAAAQREQSQNDRNLEVSKVVASSQVSSKIVEAVKNGQSAPVAQYVNAEIAKANASTPARVVASSASRSLSPKLVVPATLKVPTPSEVKSSSASAGVRTRGYIYSDP